MLSAGDSQRVAVLMRETAAAELLPRFRTLAKGDIRLKGQGDLVTVADVASERRLAVGLARILPGVPVVGEEAVENDRGLVDLIGRPGEACWIVDPLDGTANFVAGRDRFAMIVCLVWDRLAVGGWILDVPHGQMAIALKGQGATLDGIAVRRRKPERPPNGYVGLNVREEFDRQLHPKQRGRLGRVWPGSCSGVEYLEILSGQADFNLYTGAMPWDHAGGTLMLAEAGGEGRRLDGQPYAPSQPTTSGVIAAIHPEVFSDVRAVYEAVRVPRRTRSLSQTSADRPRTDRGFLTDYAFRPWENSY
jgi:fructose-1,6-bisphosphatase/inositol monophosphatase family enzyme